MGDIPFDNANYNFALARYNTNGSLDNTFDGDGMQTTDFARSSDYGFSMAIQLDGKILLAGRSYNGANYDFAVARYLTNGALDNSFSGNGKLTTAVGNNDDFSYSITIQSDGKILVAGSTYIGSFLDFGIVRYNTDGSLDNTFCQLGIKVVKSKF